MAVCDDYFSCVKFAFQNVLPLVGIILYLPIVWLFFEGRRGVFKHGFYTICLSLALGDITASFWKGIGTYVNAAILASGDYSSMACRIVGFTGRWFWYVAELHHFLVAVGRLVAVCTKHGQEDWFTGRILHFWLLLCWLLAFLLNVPVLTDAAPYVYNPAIQQFTYNYTVPTALLYQQAFDFGIQPCISSLQIIFYFLAFIRLKQTRHKIVGEGMINAVERKRRKRMEYAMLVQGFLSFLPIAVVVVCFHLLVYVTTMPVLLKQILSSVVDVFGYFVFMGSPFVYLAFNPTLRRKFVVKVQQPFVMLNLVKPIADTETVWRVSAVHSTDHSKATEHH